MMDGVAVFGVQKLILVNVVCGLCVFDRVFMYAQARLRAVICLCVCALSFSVQQKLFQMINNVHVF